jgi:AcrR family transcriptional regulator
VNPVSSAPAQGDTIPGETGRRTRGRPSVEDVARIDGEILSAALDQFIRHGYGVSMSRIVKAAAVSKNTMYARFSSKEALFRAIIRAQIDRVAETLPLGRGNDLASGLRNYANRTLEVSLERRFVEVNRLIFSEASRFPELGAAAIERNRIGIEQLCDFIRYRAEVDGIPCRDPESVAQVLIFAMRGWYLNAMLTGEAVPAVAREAWVERAVATVFASRADW